MSQKRYVPNGCYLTCDKGSSPCRLKVTHSKGAKIYGETLASEADLVPGENIFPMGACGLTNAPCQPEPEYWDKTMKAVKVNGYKLLVEDARLLCKKGGKVSIQFTRREAQQALGLEAADTPLLDWSVPDWIRPNWDAIGGIGATGKPLLDWTDYEHVVESRQKAMVYDVETGKQSLVVPNNRRDHRLKGNYGEAKQDLYMKGQGNRRISNNPTYDIDAPTRPGIDGVYEQPNGRVVVADAKYNTASLSNTRRAGRQMSNEWINANLAESIGPERAALLSEQLERTPNSIDRRVASVRTDGSMNVYEVDQDGFKVRGTDQPANNVGKPATHIERVRQSLRSSVENSRPVQALKTSQVARRVQASPRVVSANQWLARNSTSVARAGKVLGRGAIVVGIYFTGKHLKEAYDQDGEKIGEHVKDAAIEEVGGWSGALVAGTAGAEIGAVIGTAICPGLGTAIGGLAGGIVGGAIGYYSGSKMGSFVADLF